MLSGALIAIDDPRFDPMGEACGGFGIPVAIHVSDPEAFFLPIDRFNERFEELNRHPDWSFHRGDFPSNAELWKRAVASLRVIQERSSLLSMLVIKPKIWPMSRNVWIDLATCMWILLPTWEN